MTFSMSKLIEALKARETAPAPQRPVEKEVRFEKTGREMTQEQLAEIYFSATGKSKASEAPVIIRVIEKPRIASVIPWIITSLAFLVTAFSLFSTKRVFVDIKVLDEKSPYVVSQAAPGMSSDDAQAPAPIEPSHYNEKDGNPVSLEEFVFEGAAYLKSSRDQNLLTLVNSSVAPFARATVNFDRPVNMRGGKIVFYAKGARGGENLALALKDEDNNQAFSRGKIYPYPHGLTTSWQKTEILLSDLSRDFDAKRVSSFRFEFGSKDTSNRSGDTVMIRDLQWFPS